MKTKIIYISGNELFEMSDIRAAFDEVRGTLGLSSDTVLFGVPVDADDALTTTVATDVVLDAPAADSEKNLTNEIVATETIVPKTVDKPVKKSRGRPAKSAQPTVSVPEDEPAETPRAVIEPTKTPEMTESVSNSDIADPADTSNKIIPILSILAAKQETVETTPSQTAESTVPDTQSDATETITAIEEVIIDDINIESEFADENTNESQVQTEPVSIEDMISDDAPTAPVEKTLEQLLESMAPLREDRNEEQVAEPVSEPDPAPSFTTTISDEPDNADATLAQLATEFAENEDKIVAAPKNTGHGKIGKLKNILPFKKAKRDESGLMGDLFGWAGIAANDEDFSMPGFFTGAAIKK